MTMKKPREDDMTASLRPSSRLAALPRHVSEIILLYAVGKGCLVPGLRNHASFQAFACVCKDWFALLDEIVSKHALQSYSHDFHKLKRCLVLETRRQLILRRAYTTSITVDSAPDYGDLTERMWHATLSHTPRLTFLDIDSIEKYCLPAHRLADVITAASVQCPHIQTLVVSDTIPFSKRSEGDRFPVQDRMVVLATALFHAMQRWSKYEGLQCLNLDMHEYTPGFERSKAYFNAIIQYCPTITHIRGVETSTVTGSIPERWWLSVEMWDRFCRECQDLEDLNWLVLPFATEYFEIFGRYRKKKLTRLAFAAPEHVNWPRFLDEADSATRTALETKGYAGDAVKPEKVLAACPNLSKLEVNWSSKRWQDRKRARMHGEVFGDSFFRALAKNCPFLKTLSVTCVEAVPKARIGTMTNESLEALASLPYLEKVKLDAAYFDGHGVFELVMKHATVTTALKEYEFTLGYAPNTPFVPLVTIIQAFLSRLAHYDGELSALSHPTMVKFSIRDTGVLKKADSIQILQTFRAHIRKAQEKYPQLTFRGTLVKYNSGDGSFSSMPELWLSTSPSVKIPAQFSVGSLIDGVFINHPFRTYPSDPTTYPSEDEDWGSDDGSDDDSEGEDDSDDDDLEEDDDESDDYYE